MKKIFKLIICAVIIAALFTVTALAADNTIKVQLNGEPITFTDAVPQMRSNRTFIPFRAVFNALGFEDEKITYDSSTKTVKAEREDLTVSLVIGEKKVTVVKDGATSVIDTDVAAYIDAKLSRTYVPVRFVAEALGCNVGWDQDDRTVIIDDLDALIAASGSTYTVMDKLMAYSASYETGNYAVDADCKINADVNIDDVIANIKVDGKANAITSSTKADMTMKMNMSATATADGLTLDIVEMSGIPKSIDCDVRLDADKGTLAFKSAALSTALGNDDSNAWYLFDISEILEDVGMSWDELVLDASIPEITSFEDALKFAFSIIPLDDKDVTAADILPVIDSIFADSAFTKNGSNYVSSFSVNEDGVLVTLATTVYMSGDKATGYDFKLNASEPTADVSALIDIGMQNNTAVMKFNLTADDMVSIIMDINAKYTATSKAPTGTYPAGANVIDIFDMLLGEIA